MLGLLRRVLGLVLRRRPRVIAAAAALPAAPTAAVPVVEPLHAALVRAQAPRRVVGWRTRLASLFAAAGVALFGALGWLVGRGELAEPDLALSAGVQQAEHPLLLAVMALVSELGNWPLSVALVLGVAGLFWLAGARREGAFAVAAGVGSPLVGGVLKLLWLRPRPTDEAIRVVGSAPGFSFPSGHTLFFVSFFGFLFYWAYATLRRGRLRTALLWLLGLLIVLVGPSRVYLGHHWPSDVLAAYALGFAFLYVLIRLYAAPRGGAVAPRPA